MLADTNMEVVLRLPFTAFNNADIEFTKLGKLTWRFYITVKALPTTSRVEFIDKSAFAKVTLDKNLEPFVIHVSAPEAITVFFPEQLR